MAASEKTRSEMSRASLIDITDRPEFVCLNAALPSTSKGSEMSRASLIDTPHLLKGIRNNLINKNLTCHISGSKKTAKWEHIYKLYEEDPAYKGIRLVKKLSEHHVNPDKFQKMKVKYATQVFSRKVAVTMGFLAEWNILPAECAQTADVLVFFDELFDSLNGSFTNSKKRGAQERERVPEKLPSTSASQAQLIMDVDTQNEQQGSCENLPLNMDVDIPLEQHGIREHHPSTLRYMHQTSMEFTRRSGISKRTKLQKS